VPLSSRTTIPSPSPVHTLPASSTLMPSGRPERARPKRRLLTGQPSGSRSKTNMALEPDRVAAESMPGEMGVVSVTYSLV
jgi:hypothetical protein